MYKKGDVIKVKATSVKSYGVFVVTEPTEADSKAGVTNGLIHISEISDYYVKDVSGFIKEGDIVDVKVISYDKEKNQVKLSYKAIRPELLKSDENANVNIEENNVSASDANSEQS